MKKLQKVVRWLGVAIIVTFILSQFWQQVEIILIAAAVIATVCFNGVMFVVGAVTCAIKITALIMNLWSRFKRFFTGAANLGKNHHVVGH